MREVESARGEAVAGGLVADSGGAEGEGDEGREGAAELRLVSEPSGARLVVVEGVGGVGEPSRAEHCGVLRSTARPMADRQGVLRAVGREASRS